MAKQFKDLEENKSYTNDNGTVIKIKNNTVLIWNEFLKKWRKYIVDVNELLDSTWEEVMHEVDFLTAILSNSKIRLEHDLLKKHSVLDNTRINNLLQKHNQNKFLQVHDIMELALYLSKDKIGEVIKNGKWYIEN